MYDFLVLGMRLETESGDKVSLRHNKSISEYSLPQLSLGQDIEIESLSGKG